MGRNFHKLANGISLPPSAEPASPENGDAYQDSTTNKFRFYENGVWKNLGSSGQLDFLVGGDAESGITGWNSYKDAAAALPVDGTGGTITVGHTFTQSLSAPLNGTYSFLITKPASNCQGEGFSKDMTIPLGYATRAIVWQGIYSTDSNYVDDDYIVYFYDVTNSVLIQPTPYLIKANAYGTLRAEMQIPASCTSLRAIIHCATTSATTRSLKFDDMTIGPSKQARGPTLTDWKTLTGFTGSWVSNTTYSALYRQEGDSYEVALNISVSGAPTATNLNVNLPFTIDSTKLLETTSGELWIGSGAIIDTGNLYLPVNVFRVSDTVIEFRQIRHSVGIYSDHNNPINATTPFTFGAGDSINVVFKVPVVGKSSNQVVSEDHGARLVACRAGLTTAQTAVSGTVKVAYNTTASATYQGYDTTASFNTSLNRFVVPESGYYECKAQVYMGAVSAGTQCLIEIRKTGVAFCKSYERDNGGTDFTAEAKGRVYAVQGDYFEVYANGDASFNIGAGGAGDLDNFEIIKESGNQQIAASEIVKAKYSTNAGQSIPDATATTIVFEDKDFDSHNAMNTSTGEYTVPVAGTYTFKGFTMLASVGFNAGNIIYTDVLKNGVSVGQGERTVAHSTTATNYNSQWDVDINCVKGDILKVQIYQNSTGARTLLTGGTVNFVDIKRVGGVA